MERATTGRAAGEELMTGCAHERGQGYDRPMLQGSRDGLLRKIQPLSIHGQISWDVYYTDADDPEGQVATARLGPESMDRGLDPGDRIRLATHRRDVDFPALESDADVHFRHPFQAIDLIVVAKLVAHFRENLVSPR